MVLCLGQGNLGINTNWGDGWIEGSPEEKGLAVLVEEKLDMVWQCVLAAQKGKRILSCTKSSMVSRLKEIIFPIYSLLF